MNPPIDLRHVELNARCALPGPFEGEDNANPYTILQKPGAVVILYDYNHTSRVIHLDRKEHLGQGIRLFMGDRSAPGKEIPSSSTRPTSTEESRTPVSCLI